MDDFDIAQTKIGESAQRAIERAVERPSVTLANEYVSTSSPDGPDVVVSRIVITLPDGGDAGIGAGDDIDRLRARVAPSAADVLSRTFEEVWRRRHAVITNDHWLLAIARARWNLFSACVDQAGIDGPELLFDVQRNLQSAPPAVAGECRLCPWSDLMLQRAEVRAQQRGAAKPEAIDILIALLQAARIPQAGGGPRQPSREAGAAFAGPGAGRAAACSRAHRRARRALRSTLAGLRRKVVEGAAEEFGARIACGIIAILVAGVAALGYTILW